MRNWKRRNIADRLIFSSAVNADEAHLLASLISSLLELLEHRLSSAPQDPLSEITGIKSGNSAPPTDMTLRRLLPDFIRPDDGATDDGTVDDEDITRIDDENAALRSLHEPALLDAKLLSARRVLATIPSDGGDIVLEEDDAQAWLSTINDVRLALGTMLDVGNIDEERVDPRDPRAAHLDVYHWLTAIQDILVDAMMS